MEDYGIDDTDMEPLYTDASPQFSNEVEKEGIREDKCQLCDFATQVPGGLLEHLMNYHAYDCLGFRWQFKSRRDCQTPNGAAKLQLPIYCRDEIYSTPRS